MNNVYKFSFLVLLITVLNSPIIFAQSKPETFTAKNAVYLELGGNGIFYSFNYDRILYQKNAFKAAGRIGFSVYPNRIGQGTF